MIVARTRSELDKALCDFEGPRRALVPTMGALHRGHASLMARAHESAETLVVSIFVNPLQFGSGEDLSRYPRTLDADLAVCTGEGADVVFAPAAAEVYPEGPPRVTVDPGPLATILEGASRPGHFAGVLTVVTKLLGLVQPHVAIFGQKDYQQLVLVEQMVRDLCLPVEVVAAETVRSRHGLALSSRNRFLSDAERASAVVLARALHAGRAASNQGSDASLHAAQRVLDAFEGELDYLSVRAPDLGPAPPSGAARLLVAARFGSTRLIDNVALHLGPQPAVVAS
ncbi:MAG: pantoate--beta-alanine ligase [Nocardioidaceae bacterium]